MVRNEEGALDCLAHAMESKIRQTCTMHDEAYSQSRFGHLINENNDGEVKKQIPLVLPLVPDHRRIIYTIYEYAPLLGSISLINTVDK